MNAAEPEPTEGIEALRAKIGKLSLARQSFRDFRLTDEHGRVVDEILA